MNSYFVESNDDTVAVDAVPDKWIFNAAHNCIVMGTRYYDPTFRAYGIEDNYIIENIDLRNLNCVYYMQNHTNIYGWSQYKYWVISSASSSMTALEFAQQKSLERLSSAENSNFNPLIRIPPPLEINNADMSFIDDDENNLAEWLVLDIDYFSIIGPRISVLANLYAENGDLICLGSLSTEQMSQNMTELCLDSGESCFSVYFDGSTIRYSEQDGPYTIELNVYLEGHEEPCITEWYETDSLTHKKFQGALLEVTSVSDSIVNNGERIRFNITVNAEFAGSYTISCSLFKPQGDTFSFFEYEKQNLALNAGINQVVFDFDAKTIKGHGITGPYNLTIYAEDDYYASSYNYISASYSLNQLASPALYLRSPIYATSIFGSKKGSDQITIFVPLEVTVAASYSVYASIWDENSNLISISNSQPYLYTGTSNYEIIFDVFTVDLPKLEGTYTVSVGILDQNGNSMIFENYMLDFNSAN